MKSAFRFYSILILFFITIPLYSQSMYYDETIPHYPIGSYSQPLPLYRSLQTELFYKKAIEQDSTNFDAYLGLGILYKEQLRKESAEQVFNQALSLGKDSVKAYLVLGKVQEALKLEPENPDCWCALGSGYFRENSLKAIECYKKAISLPHAQAQSYIWLTVLYLSTNQKKKIEPMIQSLLKKKNLSEKEYFTIGLIYSHALENYNEAIPYFQKTIELDRSGRVYVWLAVDELAKIQSDERLLGYCKKLLTNSRDTVLANSVWLTVQNYYSNNPLRLKKLDELVDLLSLINQIPQNEKDKLDRRSSFINRFRNQIGEHNIRITLENRLKENPQEEESLWGLGLFYNSWGKNSVSITYFQKLLELQPNQAEVLFQIGCCYLLTNQIKEAKIYLEKAIAQEPDDRNAYMWLGNLYIDNGNKEELNYLLEQMESRFSNNPIGLIDISLLYERMGQIEKGIPYAHRACQLSDDWNSYKTLIRLYFAQNNTQDAEKVALDYINKPTNIQLPFYVMKTMLDSYASKKEIGKFLEFYDKASSQLSPMAYSPVIWEYFIDSYDRDKYTVELTSLLEDRFKANTLDVHLGCLLVQCYRNQFKYKDTIPVYEYIYARDSMDIIIMDRLIDSYSRYSIWDKEIEVTQRKLELQPDNYYRYLNLAGAYKALNQPDKVKEVFDTLKDIANTDSRVYSVLARGYEDAKNYPEAIVWYKKTLSADSTNHIYRISLADLYSQTGDIKNAMTEYENVLDIEPPPVDWQRNQVTAKLINLYLKTKNEQRAIKLYEKILAKTPDLWRLKDTAQKLLTDGNTSFLWELIQKIDESLIKRYPNLTHWQVVDKIYKDGELNSWTGSMDRLKMVNFLESKFETYKQQPFLYILLDAFYKQYPNRDRYQEQGEQLWKIGVQQYPNEPEPMLYLAQIYNEKQSYKQAIPLYEKALQILEKRKLENLQYYYSKLARLYVEINQTDTAERILDKLMLLIPVNSKNIGTWSETGQLYERLNNYTKAIQCYQKINEIDKWLTANFHLARCYLALKDYESAETTAIMLLHEGRKDYSLVEIYRVLMTSYDARGMYEKELDAYMKFIQDYPEYFKKFNLAFELFGISQDKNRIQKLIELLENRIKGNPKDIVSNGILSAFYFYTGKNETKPE